MYDWVNINLAFRDAWDEIAHPRRQPTRFEKEWRDYFEIYQEFDHVRYALAIATPYKDGADRDYRFKHINDRLNLTYTLAKLRNDGIQIACLFRTDISFDEQWPFPEAGWVKSPAHIDAPIFFIRPEDIQIKPLSQNNQPSASRSHFIRGIVIGGKA